MSRGPRPTPTVAISVYDHIVAGRGGGGVVWLPLADRNRSAQLEADGASLSHLRALGRHDGKGIAGCGDGLQPGARDHVPGRATRPNRPTAVELHLRLQPSCSIAIPRSWRPVQPSSNNRNLTG